MLLLVGLGNPGSRYKNTRHNAGFIAIDAVCQHYGFSTSRLKFRSEVSEGTIAGQKILAIKPQTMMNASGEAVREVVQFYKLAPSDVIVFYDELDLTPGKVRVKIAGGANGHNGIRDIDRHVGKDYRRVRMGIGHPGDKNQVHSYVLHDFSKEDKKTTDALIAAMVTSLPELVALEDEKFMTKVALILNPPSVKPVTISEDIDGI